MSKFFLGEQGEQQARHLLDTFALTSQYRVALVTSPDARALDEMRRRLALVADALFTLTPDKEIFARLDEVRGAQGKVVFWVQSMDGEAWVESLPRLNFGRDALMAHHRGLWVFAGPPDLGKWMGSYAPDTLSVATTEITLDAGPVLRPVLASDKPLEPIRFLHLSDLHFRDDQRWERRKSLEALIRHAKQEQDAGRPPNFIFCTGDVAQSGQPGEFDQAQKFFEKLTDELGLERSEGLFVVPGNHDVDRRQIGPGGILADNLQNSEQVDEVLRNAPSMDLLGGRLQAFYDFTGDVLGTARAWRRSRPWRVDERELAGGVRVAVLQLNSAWVSGPHDEEKKLLIGQEQLRDALEASADNFLRFALVHHPLEDLRDFDLAASESVLGSPGGGAFSALRASSPDPQLCRPHRRRHVDAFGGAGCPRRRSMAAGLPFRRAGFGGRSWNRAILPLQPGGTRLLDG